MLLPAHSSHFKYQNLQTLNIKIYNQTYIYITQIDIKSPSLQKFFFNMDGFTTISAYGYTRIHESEVQGVKS